MPMLSREVAVVMLGVALGCQRPAIQLAAESQAAQQDATPTGEPQKPVAHDEAAVVNVAQVVAAAPVVGAPPGAAPAKPQAVEPLTAAAQSLGPPKSLEAPKIPFAREARPALPPATEGQGKREIYKPASPAAEFVPKRLPEETVVPFAVRPLRDMPELSRGDNPRPALPQFATRPKARKTSIDPNVVPPLAPLSTPQAEKTLLSTDPGALATRSATLPLAQPTRPETSPADPRLADPAENKRAFRVRAPPPDLDPPASAPAARPLLLMAK